MTKNLVIQSFEKVKSYKIGKPDYLQPLVSPPTQLTQGIPTLKSGVYQECGPMLKERYELFGRWMRATHGHWLGIDDMERLWENNINDPFLRDIQSIQVAGEEDWPNEASALFRPERLSLFACSDITNEKIYLLWIEFEEEPELWVYDSNGESRYKDLSKYLEAYNNDDISAAGKSWRA